MYYLYCLTARPRPSGPYVCIYISRCFATPATVPEYSDCFGDVVDRLKHCFDLVVDRLRSLWDCASDIYIYVYRYIYLHIQLPSATAPGPEYDARVISHWS